MKKLLIVIIISLFFACTSKPTFTETEVNQANFFIEALNYDIESVNLSNSQNPFGAIDDGTITQILKLKKQSLDLANKIPLDVLEKMHPELPEAYSIYKEGLTLRIQNLVGGASLAEIKGSMLIDDWADWYSKNKRNIKVPKKRK